MLGPRPELVLAELHRLESLRDPTRALAERQFRRFVVRADAELHPMSRSRLDREPIEVKLRDVGRGGAGFLCSEPLVEGSTWRMCFLHHGYVIGQQAIVVRHCRPVAEGLHLIGGQFVVDTGLIALLGVDPAAVRDGDSLADDDTDPTAGFLSPGEVA